MRRQLGLVGAYVALLAQARLSYRADFFVQVGSDLLLQVEHTEAALRTADLRSRRTIILRPP